MRNDNFLERNETFLLSLNLSEAFDARLGARSSAVVTIINDDRKLTTMNADSKLLLFYPILNRVTAFVFSRLCDGG